MAEAAGLQVVLNSEVRGATVTDDKGLSKSVFRNPGADRIEISIDEAFAVSNDAHVLPFPIYRKSGDDEAATFGAGFDSSWQGSFQFPDILPFGPPSRLPCRRNVTRALVQ